MPDDIYEEMLRVFLSLTGQFVKEPSPGGIFANFAQVCMLPSACSWIRCGTLFKHMAKRILLAGLLGGIVMFLWEGLAHQVLPLGQAGIRGLDNELAVVTTLKDNVKQPGFYIFPGGEVLQPGLTRAQKQEAMKQAMEKWRIGPSGIMIVQPKGADTESPIRLVTQCLFDIGVTLLAAFLVSMAPSVSSFGTRLLFVTLIGLVPTLNTELPYWNWYAFPATYVLAQAFIHLIGFFAAGLVVAKLVKAASPSAMVAHSAALL